MFGNLTIRRYVFNDLSIHLPINYPLNSCQQCQLCVYRTVMYILSLKLCLPPFFQFTEVLIKVQVFDNSDLSPVAGAAVEIYGNQSTLASGKAGGDGVVMAAFVYRPGTWVIVTADKQGYVTNSAPWHANRVPCK